MDWRLLVKERISKIAKLGFWVNRLAPQDKKKYVLLNQTTLHRGELAGGGSVAVGLGDRYVTGAGNIFLFSLDLLKI